MLVSETGDYVFKLCLGEIWWVIYFWLWFTRVQVSKVIILPIHSHGGQVALAHFQTEFKLSCHHTMFFCYYSNLPILLLALGHSQLLIIKNGTTQSVLNLVSVNTLSQSQSCPEGHVCQLSGFEFGHVMQATLKSNKNIEISYILHKY